jgi:hypothetical protein
MEIDNKVDLTREEIKTIVHGLRMSTLSFVEDNAVDEIEAMIKALPLPEEIDKMESIKDLQANVGKIMRIIEIYSKRDMEYKTRYKSRTGLPPRYKVLDWSTKKMEPNVKASLVQGLIKISEETEKEGKILLSKGFIDCARKVAQDKYFLGDLYFLTKEALKIDNGLRKEAQALTDINLDFSDITNGLQNVSGWLKAVQSYILAKHEYLSKHPKTQVFLKQLGNIWKQVGELSESTDKQISTIKQTTQDVQNTMEKDLVPKSIMVGNQAVKINWEDDPTEPGYQRAVIDFNGKKYEVQEDQNGKRSLKEIVVTPTATTSQTMKTQETSAPSVNIEQQKELQNKSLFNPGETVQYGEKRNKIRLLEKNLNNRWIVKPLSGGGQFTVTEESLMQWKDFWDKYDKITPTTTSTQPVTSFNLKKYKTAKKNV